MIAASWSWTLVSPAFGAPWGLKGTEGSFAVIFLGILGWVGLSIGGGGDGEAPSWRSWGSLMLRWALLSLQLFMRGALITAPAWLPVFVMGVTDALNHTTQSLLPWFSGYYSVSFAVLSSVVGYFYLWSYPAVLVSAGAPVSEVQQRAQKLSRRTWPLAVCFLVLSLVQILGEGTGRLYDLWLTAGLSLQLVFVTAQTYLLFDAAQRTGFKA